MQAPQKRHLSRGRRNFTNRVKAEIGKTLQAEYHPDWNVDNVKKEARNYIRKSDFYGEKGIPKPEEKTIDNGKG